MLRTPPTARDVGRDEDRGNGDVIKLGIGGTIAGKEIKAGAFCRWQMQARLFFSGPD